MPRAGRPWTRKEVAFLQWNVNRLTIFAIAQDLGRTEASVERKLRDLSQDAEDIPRERGERTVEELIRASQLHLGDLKKAGHTWWHRIPASEVDTLPARVPVPDSTFTHSSCTGSPAAMCLD